MTVGELIEKLREFDADTQVLLMDDNVNIWSPTDVIAENCYKSHYENWRLAPKSYQKSEKVAVIE